MTGLFDRQQGLVDLERVRAQRVLVAGCGAVGANVALALLLTGFRRITFVDFDVVSRSNCSRAAGLFHPVRDLGREKAEVLAERLRGFDPDCATVSLAADVRDLGAGFYQAFDAVYCGLDNTEALLALGAACAGTGVPVFRAATYEWNASAEVIANRPDGSCLCCHRHSLPRETRVTSCGVRYLADIAAGATPTTQLSSALGANRLVLQHLLRLRGEGPAGDVRLYDTGSALQRLHPARDAACPHHDPPPAARQLPGSVHDTTLRELLGRIRTLTGAEPVLHAHDDFIVHGRCSRCAQSYPVYTPLRRLRAGAMHCPHCAPAEQPDHGEGLAVFCMQDPPEILDRRLDALGFRYADVLASHSGDALAHWSFAGDMEYLHSLEKGEMP